MLTKKNTKADAATQEPDDQLTSLSLEDRRAVLCVGGAGNQSIGSVSDRVRGGDGRGRAIGARGPR